MIPLTLAEIAGIAGGEVTGTGMTDLSSRGTAVITGPVVIDSRKSLPGALFAALPGERVDGHDYAPAAVAAGAAAVLASRPLPEAGVPVIVVPDVTAALGRLAHTVLDRLPHAVIAAITGSAGKTSTKDLTAQLAERLGPTVAPEGNFNNELGLPLTVLRADADTRYLILEMGARGIGHIAALTQIARPRIGVVLRVGRAHAGEFGSTDAVAKAKGELVEALPADGVAILNADDPNVAAMAARASARVVTFGAPPDSQAPATRQAPDVAARDIRLDDLGRPAFRLVMPGGSARVALRLHGAHHVSNALAAAAIAAELGMTVPAIADGLSAATARSKRRMELTRRADGVLVLNDAYNANPDTVGVALDALRHLASGGRRGFAVLGHMTELGEIEVASHYEVGKLAAQAGVTGLVVVGEQASPVLDGARAEPSWHGQAIAVPDGTAAVAALGNLLRPGDVVLVKASNAAGLWEVADGLLAEVDR
jgi:UDP-N-acetylmuramoyl-tripeptide--D-alanyl-D-alanine ligase